MKKILAIILACVAFAGCATIFTGSRQSIVFSGPEGTKIFSEGLLVAEIPMGYDAVSVDVKRRLSGMEMVAKKEGYKDAYFFVRSQVNGAIFVNILLGPAVLVGGAIDLVTGAAASYPNYIQIGMEPLEGAVAAEKAIDDILQY